MEQEVAADDKKLLMSVNIFQMNFIGQEVYNNRLQAIEGSNLQKVNQLKKAGNLYKYIRYRWQ